MDNPVTLVTEFVLDRIHDEPVEKRIALCRALAQLTGDAAERLELLQLATELERIERRQRKLTLGFKQRSS